MFNLNLLNMKNERYVKIISSWIDSCKDPNQFSNLINFVHQSKILTSEEKSILFEYHVKTVIEKF